MDFLALQRAIFAPPPSLRPTIPLPESLPLHGALAAATILHHFISQPSLRCHVSTSSQSPLKSDNQSKTIAPSQNPTLSSSVTPLFARLHPLKPVLLSNFVIDSTAQRRLYLASALTPFKGLTYVEKKKTKLIVEACIREGLKVPTPHTLVSILSDISLHSLAFKAITLTASQHYTQPQTSSSNLS